MNQAVLERLVGGPEALTELSSLARMSAAADKIAAGRRLDLREMLSAFGERGAITASGYYGLTLEKHFTDALGVSLESETLIKVGMVEDGYTPDFNAHDFRNDITNEVAGTAYTAGGQVITATEITVAGGLLTFDAGDVAWAASTIPNAMAAYGYVGRGGASSADELLWLSDFVTAASTSAGTFTIQWHASGIFTVDFTP